MVQKYFNDIEFQLIKKLIKLGYGIDRSEIIISQLSWNIETGRCSTDRLYKILNSTSRQQTTIAKRLAINGSQDECLSNAFDYIDKI